MVRWSELAVWQERRGARGGCRVCCFGGGGREDAALGDTQPARVPADRVRSGHNEPHTRFTQRRPGAGGGSEARRRLRAQPTCNSLRWSDFTLGKGRNSLRCRKQHIVPIALDRTPERSLANGEATRGRSPATGPGFLSRADARTDGVTPTRAARRSHLPVGAASIRRAGRAGG